MAEPQKGRHDELMLKRKCRIETRAVYSQSGKNMNFDTTKLPSLSRFSILHSSKGRNFNLKEVQNLYLVETISLNDMLLKHEAPREIDYISIDTEGSEFEILSTFDFRKYSVKIWTIEHNWSENRSKIENLLKESGYRRVFSNLSQVDDWYISSEIILNLES